MDKHEKLHEILVDCLIEDLLNEERRSPALYGVAARVVNDNKERLSGMQPPRMESLDNIVPFKLKKA
jgi:hypothetical protein